MSWAIFKFLIIREANSESGLPRKGNHAFLIFANPRKVGWVLKSIGKKYIYDDMVEWNFLMFVLKLFRHSKKRLSSW